MWHRGNGWLCNNSHSRAIGVVYLSFSTRGDKQGFEGKEQCQSPYLCCCTLRSPQNHQENSQFWAGKRLFREGTETLQTAGRRAFKSALKVEKAVQNYSRHLPAFVVGNYFRLYLIRCLMMSWVIELRLVKLDLFSKKFRQPSLINIPTTLQSPCEAIFL